MVSTGAETSASGMLTAQGCCCQTPREASRIPAGGGEGLHIRPR